MKDKIIIFGTGGLCKEVLKFIKYDNIDILCFVDNEKCKHGQEFMGRKIEAPIKLLQLEFDYIIVLSSYYDEISSQLLKIGISEDKIIQLNHIDNNPKIYDFLQSSNEYHGVVTGISYAECGIDTKYFSEKIYNFALSSQDLYYNYKTLKYLFEQYYEKIKNVKYAIVTLQYYSFHYDFSLTNNFKKNIGSYLMFDDFNNFKDKDFIEKVKVKNKVLEKIFEIDKIRFCLTQQYKNNLNNILNKTFDFNKFSNLMKDNTNLEKIGKEHNKYFPETEKENMKIFEEYIKFLLQKGITPIIVILPQQRNIINKIDNSSKIQFYNILNKYIKKYNFRILDYFQSDIFNYSDFYDVSHLNNIGSKKFTQLLENEILWEK